MLTLLPFPTAEANAAEVLMRVKLPSSSNSIESGLPQGGVLAVVADELPRADDFLRRVDGDGEKDGINADATDAT